MSDSPHARLATLEDILARDDAGRTTLLPETRMRFLDERDQLREQLALRGPAAPDEGEK